MSSHPSNWALTVRLSGRHALWVALAGMVLSVVVGLLAFTQSSLLRPLDRALLDALVRSTAAASPATATVAVDIGDTSLAAVGQWPWPRYRIGSMVQQIAQAEPAAIALDILFPEPDRTSLASVRETFKRDFGVELAFDGVPEGLRDNDGYLGQVIARTDVVAARYFYFDHRNAAGAPPTPGVLVTGRTDLLELHQATGVLENVRPVAAATRLAGFINSPQDDDGLLRRLPLLIAFDGRIHASLALTAALRAMGQTSVAVEDSVHGLRLRVGPHAVPIDRKGYALLRFQGGPTLYPTVQAVDILNGSYRASDLRGKVVFVGSTAVTLGDHRATAVETRFPGLQVHAVMAENILQDRFVTEPRWGPAAMLVASLVAGMLMTAIFVRGTGTAPFVGGSMLVGGGAAALGVVLFAAWGFWVPPTGAVLVVALLFLVFMAARFAIETRRARIWRKQLENARQVTIESMASVAETRDPETGAHIKRTQNYVRAIALELRRSGQYTSTLTDVFIELLYISAPLHDIGKVGVPDHILLKPGRLTPDEMELMKQHAELGRRIICNTAQRINGENFLTIAGDIAATHHEKWDGTGYPLGLRGQDIPLSGRIMAAADIYDALISRRCYKEPFPHEVAIDMMRKLRGVTFDPAVLDAFFRIEDEIKSIAANFRDEEEIAHDGALHPEGGALPLKLRALAAPRASGFGEESKAA
jgi:adenylate cyclase